MLFKWLEFDFQSLGIEFEPLEIGNKPYPFDFKPLEIEFEPPEMQFEPLEIGNKAEEIEFKPLQIEFESLGMELEAFLETPDRRHTESRSLRILPEAF